MVKHSLLLLLFVSGCANVVDSSGKDVRPPPPDFDEFVRETYRVPTTGTYIVDGDTPVRDLKRLREFYDLMMNDYEAEVHHEDSSKSQGLCIMEAGGADVEWDATQKMNLTYCVSPQFGSNQAQVIQAMADATSDWMGVINVHFAHSAGDDANCSASDNNVVFDVAPQDAGGQFIASSFFPNEGRAQRELVVDPSAFSVQAPLTLRGVFRHELGHILGFRHEHTRPEAGTCFEDNNWRPLTPYDSASVMHYPQCNGTGDWSLSLTQMDIQGSQSVYGAATGSNPSQPPPPPPPPPSGDAEQQTFSGSVAQGATTLIGVFNVVAGSTFNATMSGSGDPDLYVQFGAQATSSSYACRPYVNGPSETCALNVPAGATQAYVSVNGYAAATYVINVSWTQPPGAAPPTTATPPPPPPSSGTAQTATFSGSVAQNANKTSLGYNVVAGTTFTATMTGTGDPDLYVRFGAVPTTTSYACRPYVNGPNEQCQITVPAGQTTAFIMVRGYTAATYNVALSYTSP